MKRLAALLILLAATPALAANDETPTILRGTPAPPPPAVVEVPVPQVIEVPVYYPQPVYYYALPLRRPVVIHHHHFRH
ncbi:MAG: hypothetical protein ACM3II_12495 [Rhodospirillaceae bacterium]